MKSICRILPGALAACLSISALHAQVPQLINYQGRVAVGGVNFPGPTGQFKFALVDAGAPAVQATGFAGLNGSGGVQVVVVTNPGFGYLTPPAVTFSGGGGGGAAATAIINGGRVVGIGVAAPGSYIVPPTVTIGPPTPGNHTSTIWSNNNSSSLGSEPTAALSLPVINGLYSVLLGNTDPAKPPPVTAAILPSVWANPDVRLRVWFSNGNPPTGSGFQLLSPDQRLAPNGYLPDGSVSSAAIASGAITSTKLATGAVQSTNIAAGSVGSTQIAAGAVGSTQIASGAVTSANIAVNTITGTEIGDELQLGSTNADGTLRLWDNGTDSQTIRLLGGSSSIGIYSGLVQPQIFLDAGASGGVVTLSMADGTDTVSIEASETGTDGAHITLSDAAGTPTVLINAEDATEGGAEMRLANGSGDTMVTIEASEDGSDGASIYLRNAAGDVTLSLDAEFGADSPSRVTSGTVEITGGSDFAEQFDIHSKPGEPAPEPGMIVCIDPACPGKLRPSTDAYDRTVAGIISGAGGIRPGMLMGQQGSVANGAHPVALSGRVYCYIDTAEGGPIAPGDLITTSAKPGHGMKATDHERARGAIIGKAMTGLADGAGLVLVLVSLQ